MTNSYLATMVRIACELANAQAAPLFWVDGNVLRPYTCTTYHKNLFWNRSRKCEVAYTGVTAVGDNFRMGEDLETILCVDADLEVLKPLATRRAVARALEKACCKQATLSYGIDDGGL